MRADQCNGAQRPNGRCRLWSSAGPHTIMAETHPRSAIRHSLPTHVALPKQPARAFFLAALACRFSRCRAASSSSARSSAMKRSLLLSAAATHIQQREVALARGRHRRQWGSLARQAEAGEDCTAARRLGSSANSCHAVVTCRKRAHICMRGGALPHPARAATPAARPAAAPLAAPAPSARWGGARSSASAARCAQGARRGGDADCREQLVHGSHPTQLQHVPPGSRPPHPCPIVAGAFPCQPGPGFPSGTATAPHLSSSWVRVWQQSSSPSSWLTIPEASRCAD